MHLPIQLTYCSFLGIKLLLQCLISAVTLIQLIIHNFQRFSTSCKIIFRSLLFILMPLWLVFGLHQCGNIFSHLLHNFLIVLLPGLSLQEIYMLMNGIAVIVWVQLYNVKQFIVLFGVFFGTNESVFFFLLLDVGVEIYVRLPPGHNPMSFSYDHLGRYLRLNIRNRLSYNIRILVRLLLVIVLHYLVNVIRLLIIINFINYY